MSIPYIIITQKAPPGSGKEGEQISYARTVTRQKIGTEELAGKISKISTVSISDVMALFYGLREVAPEELSDGNIVDLAGLGAFWITSGTGALESPDKVAHTDFRTPRIHYRPADTFRQMLKEITFKPKR